MKQKYEDRYPSSGVSHGVLVLAGRKIEDTRTLSEQGISNEVTLVALPKARWTSANIKWDENTNAPRLKRFDGG